MQCSEIVKFFEELAPIEFAEEWDNTGLLLGSKRQKINRVLVCLDVTSGAAGEALEKKADLIVSHHPLIFKSMKKLNEDDITGKIIYRLIKGNTGVCCAHTNLDTAEGGVNDCLALMLGLSGIKKMDSRIDKRQFDINIKEYNPGRVGLLQRPVSLSEFIIHVKNVLAVDNLRMTGERKCNIEKVAVFSGSFDGNFSGIKREKADILVTGELKYHDAIAAVEEGLCVIEAGHYATEVIIVNELASKLRKRFPDIDVICCNSGKDPLVYV
jgi:GTP cyclohydrolase I